MLSRGVLDSGLHGRGTRRGTRMDRDGVIAFLVTALGAICVALLALGPVFYVYKHGFGGNLPGSVDGEAVRRGLP